MPIEHKARMNVFTEAQKEMSAAMQDELDYLVEEVDGSGNTIIQVLARAAHFYIGRAAFMEAIRINPKRHIHYRHKARLLGKHPENERR